MKYCIILSILIFLAGSCSNNECPLKSENITTDFTVTKYYVTKYTYIQGYIIYNDLCIYLTNGAEGYNYKRYNIKEKEILKVNIKISYFKIDNGYKTEFEILNFKDFEKHD